MAYGLSFAPEFFLAEGEPYDRGDLATNDAGRPTSLYSAILMALADSDRRPALLEILGVKEQHAPMDDTLALELLDRAQQVNTCGSLGPGAVDVWLDSDGWVTVEVW